MDRVLIFDLYTKKSFDDVGGKKGIENMGIAIAASFQYQTNEIIVYQQNDIEIMVHEILTSRLIIGINLKRFALKVVSALAKKDLTSVNVLDISDHLKKKLGIKPTIEGLFRGTFNESKNVHHMIHISNLYKQGKISEIETLCKSNILDLKKLYDFGCQKGHLFYGDDTGQRWKVQVDW